MVKAHNSHIKLEMILQKKNYHLIYIIISEMFSKLTDYKIRYTRTHLKNHHILHLINKAFLLRRAWDMHTVKLPPPKTLDP